jgi:CHAT domain-containing protein
MPGQGESALLTLNLRVDNPLSRSALALAGAARAEPRPTADQDGLLTAEEVRSLNLWGTELVVLSACESGRGAVSTGQGVYGLRRAFFVAGAETLVIGLWQVADQETGDLMGLYYQKLILERYLRVGAMRAAMQQMRSRKPHPYYWAPFLVLGLDAPFRVRATSRPTTVN